MFQERAVTERGLFIYLRSEFRYERKSFSN